MARIMGCSYQNVQQRSRRGEAVQVALQAAAERGGGVVRIADLRTARAVALAAANVEDVTGSQREREALRATGTDNVRYLHD
jgi:hypothetical protein